MLINELFTRAVNWKYGPTHDGRVRATFRINKISYKVYLDDMVTDSAIKPFELEGPSESFTKMWDVTFSSTSDDADESGEDYEKDDITGEGNAITVFSTVIDIIQTIAKKYNIQNLFFTAHEPSRIKLYDRMSKYFAKNGWRYIDDNEIAARRDGPSFVHLFLLTKQQPPLPHHENH